MTLYKGKYRVATTRWPGWNYAAVGCYFVTICTAHRQSFFGDIASREMRLSDIGLVAQEEWVRSAQLRSNIDLDAFVIMPNHIHGIVVIRDDAPSATDAPPNRRDAPRRVSTGTPNKFGPLARGSLQSVINGYKGAVTRWCRANRHPEFAWQSRFWDRVVRDEHALTAIRAYIANNVRKWAQDRDNAGGLYM